MRVVLLGCLVFLVVGCGAWRDSLKTRGSMKQVNVGARMLEKGNKSLALKSFDRALADSSDREVYLDVVGLLIQKGMYRESIPYIGRAVLLPDNSGRFRIVDSNLYTILGDAYWKLGDLARAETAYQQAVRLNVNNAGAYNDWGYMLAESNQQLDKALELTRKAVRLHRNNGYFLDSLGWVYYQKGDPARALKYLKKAAELSSSELEVRFHYAKALDATGSREAALVEYSKVVKLSPSNAPAKERIRKLYPKNTSK